jgi:hypothetical protein
MAMRPTDHIWTVLESITDPVPVADPKREIWVEERQGVLHRPWNVKSPEKPSDIVRDDRKLNTENSED